MVSGGFDLAWFRLLLLHEQLPCMGPPELNGTYSHVRICRLAPLHSTEFSETYAQLSVYGRDDYLVGHGPGTVPKNFVGPTKTPLKYFIVASLRLFLFPPHLPRHFQYPPKVLFCYLGGDCDCGSPPQISVHHTDTPNWLSFGTLVFRQLQDSS